MLCILSSAEPKLPKRLARLHGLKTHQATNTLTEHYPKSFLLDRQRLLIIAQMTKVKTRADLCDARLSYDRR
jgi:hypothetical protein